MSKNTTSVQATVLIVTYNHAAYIETALTGVLSQKTDFAFEIIISEDCSTDGTREIVQQFASEHPDQVRLFLSERNLNDNTVMRRGFEAAEGRFIALLDGDDRWTDHQKLQRQVDFLSCHPECSGCFHNVQVVYEDRPAANRLLYRTASASDGQGAAVKPVLTLSDIAIKNHIQTCSAVLRTALVQGLPGWYDDLPVGDWPLFVFCAEHGELAYLDQTMSEYRVHKGGYWSTSLAQFREISEVEEWVRMHELINEHLGFRFDDEIDAAVALFYEQRAVEYYKRAKYGLARVCARRALSRSSVIRWGKRRRTLAMLALMTLPEQLRWRGGSRP